MKNQIIFGFITITLGLFSCERDPVNLPVNLRDVVVPADFSWSNVYNNRLTISMANTSNLAIEGRVLQLLDPNGIIIEQGVVKDGKVQFNTDIPYRSGSMTLFFPMTRKRQEIPVSPGQRTITFNIGTGPEMALYKSGGTSPSCDDGCGQVFSGNLTNLEIKTDGVYCLTGNLNGGLTITKNVTLRICGTANITWSSISTNKTVKIIVTTTGSLTSSSFYLSGTNHSLENYGTISLNNWLDVKSTLDNHGTMEVKGLEVLTNGHLTNYNTFTSNGEINVSGQITNNKTLTIKGSTYNLNISYGGLVTNNCRFEVPRNLNSNGGIVSNGYFHVGGFFYGESRGTLKLGNEGMFHCTNFQPNCAISCTAAGGFGAIKVDGITNLDAKTSFTGHIDLCDANGIDANWGATVGTNVTYCEVYVPVTSCNPEGVGTPKVQDADKDGIVDDEDEFPDDATRAFKRAEPYSGYKIWAFEDLWPSTGDYDFNDLVLSTRIVYTLGPDRRPVEAEVQVSVRALGAGLNNGIGLQFLGENVPLSNYITSVEGSKVTLDPATNRTIVVSDDIKSDLKPFYNNNGVGPKNSPQDFSFMVTFSGSQVTGRTSLYSDFFLYRTADRSHEIHIAGMPGTTVASTDKYGTSEDATNPSKGYWYKTRNGIPWGLTLVILESEWHHPIEKISILEAFPDFREWAVSVGNDNPEWYRKGVYEKCFHF